VSNTPRVEWAALGISVVALALSAASFLWRIYEWRQSRAFDVRARIDCDLFPVGSGKYEATVVVENHGARVEAVDTISLVPSRSEEHGVVVLQSGGIWDTTVAGNEVPPNRNFKRTYDLLSQRYGEIPSEITAVVELESGKRVHSPPYEVSEEGMAVVMAGRRLPAAAEKEGITAEDPSDPDERPPAADC
jgi:hypothetical protein